MSHPTHPATVHFPITTTLLTGGLDAVYFLSTYAPTSSVVASAFKTLDIAIQPNLFPLLSYYTTILTLLFSAPAVATGAYELMPLIKRDGLSSKKAQTGILHAAINDITVFGALYNWWSRRSAPAFIPSNENVLVSTVLAVPATFFAAYLGGSLVYQYGMGFRGSSAKAKKQQ
ncbi:Nn.00g043630.m01.CDS01 [Neocucurbitaria sp. VM-36]